MFFKYSNINRYIEPLLRGLGVLLFALFLLIKYDTFIEPKYHGKTEFITILFNYIDKLGGKFLLVGIFVVIGIIMIIHDYHKKFGKSEK